MASSRRKTVLITGVTRGLGLAMTCRFIDLGHTVAGCGRTKSQVEKLRRQKGKPSDFQVVDVSSDEEVKTWAESVLKDFGPPDLVLNNAGLMNRLAPLWNLTDREFSDVLDVNLRGIANVIRHITPAMTARGKGVIVNFTSGWGRSTDSHVAPYCATKWAVEGLTQALAQELPRGMATVALNPGIINTDMLQQCFGTDAASYPDPGPWAIKAVPFLLSLGPRDNGKSLDAPA